MFLMITQMDGEIKMHGFGFGSDVHESVHGWLTEAQRRKTLLKKPGGGDGGDPDSGGEVKVTRAAAADERAAGTSRGMLMTAHPPPPDLDEIVTVDGGYHGLRTR